MNQNPTRNNLIAQLRLLVRSLLESLVFVHQAMGVLLVYVLACTFFVDFVAFNIFRGLWSLALRSIPGNYLTDQNITQLLRHPISLLIGVLITVCFCIICLWQNAGILMIIEYNRQGQPVKLFSIFYESLLQVKHAFKPSNWMIFVYMLLILPLTDPNMTMSVFSEMVIPEFIMDFILAKKLLAVIFAVASAVVLYFYYRFVFVQYCFVLEQKSFSESVRVNRRIGLKAQIYAGITQQIVASAAGLLYIGIPMMLLGGIAILMTSALSSSGVADAAATFIYNAFGVETCKLIGRAFVKLIVSVYMVNTFHRICDEKGVEPDIALPENCVKKEGRIRSFRMWVYAACAALYLVFAGAVGVMICLGNLSPESVKEIIGEMEIAAHKGYSSKAPENTMDAFELAANSDSVSYIELDVRTTKDGVPVVIHNESLKEATGKNISVYNVDYDELSGMAASYTFKAEYPKARISSLEDVLEKYSERVRFIIEIKDSPRSPDLPYQVARLMEKYDIVETSVVHSGSYDAITKVKEANPAITCGYIVAVSMGGFYDLENADFFSLEHDFATSRVIKNIHDRGKKVFVWTVNETRSMEDVRYSGIDAVITDYPDECAKVVNSEANLLREVLDNTGEQMGLDDIGNIYAKPDSVKDAGF